MRLRALTLILALVVSLGAGCGAAGGKIMADTKVPTKEDPNAVLVPYASPDISELTGIEEDDADEAGSAPAQAPTPEPRS